MVQMHAALSISCDPSSVIIPVDGQACQPFYCLLISIQNLSFSIELRSPWLSEKKWNQTTSTTLKAQWDSKVGAPEFWQSARGGTIERSDLESFERPDGLALVA